MVLMPLEPLWDAVEAESVTDFCRKVGYSRNAHRRWKIRGGIPSWLADELALRQGKHPVEIWPEWFVTAEEEEKCRECGELVPPNRTRFCSRACNRRFHHRLEWADRRAWA